ncbi:hypothetical protein Poli38472_010687 [Pythium oligandrum]|uniref:VPS9 domain-containing protein n=1 Tax=Pythium oligandrum TaxID=41045 RepID=A0A8K1CEM3_PYTOL|nr:hypothetical protein Poli38472_010687 [Pythium oligandrum]|eukprot:TMW61624.1 hypothetical protein Poli38472_010687 [Pythium oligandrum]
MSAADRDLFLAALAHELATTQRLLPSNCVFCVPQARSLVADVAVSQDDVFTHFLLPVSRGTEQQPGQYETLNGKTVSIIGSQVHTRRGFDEPRKVRILLSEQRDVHHQEIMLLHLSRPLIGGIVLPEDPNEIDLATFRRYTAILRSFPENELVFFHLDETIAQVRKICRLNQFANRYESTLPQILKEEWGVAVEEIANGGSFADEEEEGGQYARSTASSHWLQIQQVVECYLMEQLHDYVFPHVQTSARSEDEKLVRVLHRMRHYTPRDFGIRKEFQCDLREARDELLSVLTKKTPLEMLLGFKTCIDHINDGVTRNLNAHHHSIGSFQMTTDDILDELLFVLIQAYNIVVKGVEKEADRVTAFPLASTLRYVSDYHFINSNTSALGYTIANFQVAVEYFLMKAVHTQNCNLCIRLDSDMENECPQAIAPAKIELAHAALRQERQELSQRRPLVRRSSNSFAGNHGAMASAATRLCLLGAWSSADEETEAADAIPTQFVTTDSDMGNLTQISSGHRFFACVNEDGALFSWGDRSGGRLGYAAVDGETRRVMQPRVVSALRDQRITQVACGAFHTLATDINGHVFAWGQNARGQLGFLTRSVETTMVNTPTLVADLKGVYVGSVACGEYHSLGLSSDGRVFSWGCNKFSKLGRPTSGLLDAVQPRVVEAQWTTQGMVHTTRNGSNEILAGIVRRIAAGRDHSVAVTFDGGVFTWGRGDEGQLGHGCHMDISEPRQVMTLADDDGEIHVVDADAGGTFTVFLLGDGTVCVSGRVLTASTEDNNRLAPRLLSLPLSLDEYTGKIVGVACGDAHYALLTETGDVLHSVSTIESTEELVRVDGVATAKRIRAGATHTLALV